MSKKKRIFGDIDPCESRDERDARREQTRNNDKSKFNYGQKRGNNGRR